MNWINIKDQLPEEISELIIEPKDDLLPLMTKKLIVLTDHGQVSDNKRLKMQVGEKEWVWFMSYDGESVTHWTIFEDPKELTIKTSRMEPKEKAKELVEKLAGKQLEILNKSDVFL